MAFTCGFFNSQNGDRKYNAEQMASIFDGLIKDGVYDTVGEIFAVTPGTGMQVLVGSGRAWFDHTWNNNDASYPLAITAADVSLPRYDAVVLETNHSDTVRTNRLRVVTGTPASNPVKPTMASSANVKQHPLAYIKVTAGAKAITQSMIQVVVGTSECPFVTGIIDTAEIDALFQQWNGEFNEWFENLKAQLSDNVVANLQGQIDQKVAKADVATTADIEAGTSTTKWVTPKGLREAGVISKVGDIEHTFRTDLGNDWALCNGDIFSPDEYPELYSLSPSIFSGKYWTRLGSGGAISGGFTLAGNDELACVVHTNGTSNQNLFTYNLKTRTYIKGVKIDDYPYCSAQDSLLLNNNTLIIVGCDPYSNYARVIEVTNIMSDTPNVIEKSSAEFSGNGSGTAYYRIGYNKLTGQCAAVINDYGKLGIGFRDTQGNWTTVTNIASINTGWRGREFMNIKSDGTNWIVVVDNKLFVISSSGTLISSIDIYDSASHIKDPYIINDGDKKHVVCVVDNKMYEDFTFTSWASAPTSRILNTFSTANARIFNVDKVGNEYTILGLDSSTPRIYTSNDFSNWTLQAIPIYYYPSASDNKYITLIFAQQIIVIKNYMVVSLLSNSANIALNGPQLPEQPSDKNGYNYIKVK